MKTESALADAAIPAGFQTHALKRDKNHALGNVKANSEYWTRSAELRRPKIAISMCPAHQAGG
jgi:hypothetical protein